MKLVGLPPLLKCKGVRGSFGAALLSFEGLALPFCLLKVGSPCCDLMRPLCALPPIRGDTWVANRGTRGTAFSYNSYIILKFEILAFINVMQTYSACIWLKNTPPDPPLVAILPGLVKKETDDHFEYIHI